MYDRMQDQMKLHRLSWIIYSIMPTRILCGVHMMYMYAWHTFYFWTLFYRNILHCSCSYTNIDHLHSNFLNYIQLIPV